MNPPSALPQVADGGVSSGEVLLHTIDLGLLTKNRDVFSSGVSDELHRQYFQQRPALHGAWGNVIGGDRSVEAQCSRCYLEVRNAKGQSMKYLLRSQRGVAGVMNRLHINVPQSFAASVVVLYRDGSQVLTRELQRPAGGTRFTVNGRS